MLNCPIYTLQAKILVAIIQKKFSQHNDQDHRMQEAHNLSGFVAQGLSGFIMGPGRTQNEPNDRPAGDPEDAIVRDME